MAEERHRETEIEQVAVGKENIYESLFHNSHATMLLIDPGTGRIVDANPAATQFYGYSKGELTNMNIYDINMLTRSQVFQEMENAKLSNRNYFLFPHRLSNGEIKDVEVYSGTVRVDGQDLLYSIIHDISEKARIEKDLAMQKSLFQQLFDNSPEAIVMLDQEYRVLRTNEAFEKLFQYTEEEIRGRPLEDLVIPWEAEQVVTLRKELEEKKSLVKKEALRKRKDGSQLYVSIVAYPIFSSNTQIGNYVIYSDITERKEAELEIKRLSYHDRLTGLYNRSFFDESLKKLNEEGELPFSIIVGDVNGLKLINDVFGHEEGDRFLIKIANILKECCSQEDVVCRWGGDEFAIILSKGDEKMAEQRIQAIYRRCEREESETIKVSISLGSAVKYKREQSISQVIKEAEERMYRTKLLMSKSNRSHIVASLQQSLFERSHETEEHGERMKKLAVDLGRRMGLNTDQLNELSLLAILHDIGKIAISDHILGKPGPLTDAEWEEMKRHCEIGYRIAETSPELIHISRYILFHHERWDGSGYPQGLRGEEIPLLSRILAVVDAYDVMTHERVYKRALDDKEALEEIERGAGSQFDPKVARAFIEMIEKNRKG